MLHIIYYIILYIILLYIYIYILYLILYYSFYSSSPFQSISFPSSLSSLIPSSLLFLSPFPIYLPSFQYSPSSSSLPSSPIPFPYTLPLSFPIFFPHSHLIQSIRVGVYCWILISQTHLPIKNSTPHKLSEGNVEWCSFISVSVLFELVGFERLGY